MLTRFFPALAVGVLLAGGCSSYYAVTDPHSGRQYYTSSLDEKGNGSVVLKDAKTGEKVTIQNSQVKEISKEKYETVRMTSGDLSPEAQAKEAKAQAQREADARLAEARAAEAKAAEARAAEQRAEQERLAQQREADAQAAQARAAQERAAQEKAVAETRQAEAQAAKAKADAAEAELAAARMKPAATLPQLRANLVSSKDQIDRTLAALTDLTSPTQADLKGAYTRYSQEVDRLNQQATMIKAEADGMRTARQAYFDKWDTQTAATDNPTIRAQAEAKRQRIRAAQEKISADSTAAKDAYAPFITDLQDTKAFLAKDLSKDTISVLSPTVKKAQEDGAVVKQKIDVLIADLDTVENPPAPGAVIVPPANPIR